MSESKFGFYFEVAGKAAAQGAIAPAEQFFEGSMAEVSLARETGQNSIDARSGVEPVVMEFELATVDCGEIPGIEGLRQHMEQVEKETRGAQGHDRMVTARDTAHKGAIPVLRIGDYGTKGLAGSESLEDPHSPLSALTRGAGISAADGSRGGSFGIGSAVGPMASDMCTVLYTSMPLGSSEVVFAGYSRLASHRDADGVWRVGDGFFSDLGDEDFHYLRNPPALPPFGVRTEPGTDVYVLGYRKADADPTLSHIKKAFMNHFLLALHRGELIVRGITSEGVWELNAETLKEHLHEAPEAAAFYRAICDPSPVQADSRRFGRLKLYINVDDTLEKTLHTIAVRRPLMRIETFRHTSIPAKYAAVLECSDEPGNGLLRVLEPPQHHEWDPGRSSEGPAALRELKEFVRKGLKERVKEQIGDQVEVKGLARYLPTDTIDGMAADGENGGAPTFGDGVDEESSTVHGADSPTRPAFNQGGKSVRVGVRTAADSDGDLPTLKGKDRGGEGKRTGKDGGLDGTGGRGDGGSRISAGDVRFRSWSDPATGELIMALTAAADIAGSLELVALGPGGTEEDDYQLPIADVVMETSDGIVGVAREGNTLTDVSLQAGITSQLRLKLASSHRYRLGVK